MIPNPIRKVLSTMEAHQVRVLLMGGQACVFYGAAEFNPSDEQTEEGHNGRERTQRREPQPKQTDVEAGKMPELSEECLSGE